MVSGVQIIAIFALSGSLNYSLIAKWYVMPQPNTLPHSPARGMLLHRFPFL